jgi:hypothetical protein
MLTLELVVLKKVDNLSHVGGKIKATERQTPHINRDSLLVILQIVPIADLTMVVYQKAPQAIQLDISTDLLQKITAIKVQS